MQPPPTEPARSATDAARRAARRDRAGVLRSVGLRRLLAGLLLAWSAAVLAHQAAGALAGWRDRRQHRTAAVLWRFGIPQTVWLTRCLATADAAAEPGSRIRVLAPREDFFRGRWAAYFLPAHDVLPEHARPEDADLVVALHGATFPGARVVGGTPRCRLLQPPGARGGPAAGEPP